MLTPKKIILCADDYAQSKAISKGILELVHLERLSAVSCMTQSHDWPAHAKEISAFKSIDLGLHFNLTQVFDEQYTQKLTRLIAQSLTLTLPLKKINESLNKQLDYFESALNRSPDFVDGHHHVHLFPGIRHVVLKTLQARYPDKKPYLRLAFPPLTGHDALFKALVLRFLGQGFKKEVIEAGFPFPPFFSGFYSLKQKADYPRYLKNCLHHVKSGTLIMCHPGLLPSNLKDKDPLALSRWQEFSYLRSPAFEEALKCEEVKIVRFKEFENVKIISPGLS